jgi:hypothetical protein
MAEFDGDLTGFGSQGRAETSHRPVAIMRPRDPSETRTAWAHWQR